MSTMHISTQASFKLFLWLAQAWFAWYSQQWCTRILVRHKEHLVRLRMSSIIIVIVVVRACIYDALVIMEANRAASIIIDKGTLATA